MLIRKFEFVNFDIKPLPYASWSLSYQLSYIQEVLKGRHSIHNILCGYDLHAKVIQSFLLQWCPDLLNSDSVIGDVNKQFKNMQNYWPLDKLDKTFDAVISIGGLDRMNSREQIQGLIQNCYDQLNPGGRLVLTGTTPKTNPEWVSYALKQDILVHGTVVNGANSEYAQPEFTEQNIILLDIEKPIAPQYFNWDKVVGSDQVEQFLSEDYLWGQNQDCNNVGRREWVKYISDKVGDEPIKVLELGFGAGVCYRNLCTAGLVPDRISYYGVDVTPVFVEYAKSNLKHMQALQIDGFVLPFKHQAFDYTYCRHLIEHQENYEQLLRDILWVTKKNVFLNFFIPLHDGQFDVIKWDGNFYHNHYSRDKFAGYAAKYGFSFTHLKTYTTGDKVDYLVVLDRG